MLRPSLCTECLVWMLKCTLILLGCTSLSEACFCYFFFPWYVFFFSCWWVQTQVICFNCCVLDGMPIHSPLDVYLSCCQFFGITCLYFPCTYVVITVCPSCSEIARLHMNFQFSCTLPQSWICTLQPCTGALVSLTWPIEMQTSLLTFLFLTWFCRNWISACLIWISLTANEAEYFWCADWLLEFPRWWRVFSVASVWRLSLLICRRSSCMWTLDTLCLSLVS